MKQLLESGQYACTCNICNKTWISHYNLDKSKFPDVVQLVPLRCPNCKSFQWDKDISKIKWGQFIKRKPNSNPVLKE